MLVPTLNNPINKIIIHHTAVSYMANPDQWEQTNEYHRLRFNFKSSLDFYVGYTYEISKDGLVRQARALGEETAAVIGQNKASVSICLDGNFDIEYPTIEQQKALRSLIHELMAKYPQLTAHKIFPHRAFCGTPPYKSCFGRQLPDNWATLLIMSDENACAMPALGGVPQTRHEAE